MKRRIFFCITIFNSLNLGLEATRYNGFNIL